MDGILLHVNAGSPALLLMRLSFLQCIFVKNQETTAVCMYVWVFCSTCLFLCLCHAGFVLSLWLYSIIGIGYYNVPSVALLITVALASWEYFSLCTSMWILGPTLEFVEERHWNLKGDCIGSVVDHFRQNSHFIFSTFILLKIDVLLIFLPSAPTSAPSIRSMPFFSPITKHTGS